MEIVKWRLNKEHYWGKKKYKKCEDKKCEVLTMSSPSGDKIIVQFNLKKKVNGKKVFTKKPNRLPREMGLVDSSKSSQGEKRNKSLMTTY